MPGVSRSGITITTGRFSRLNRDASARFSFLLLIPIVLGAVLYKGLKHVVLDPLPAGSTGPFIVGTIAAAAVGLVAIDVLLGYLRKHDYTPFVIYRLALARRDRRDHPQRLARSELLGGCHRIDNPPFTSDSAMLSGPWRRPRACTPTRPSRRC